MVTDIIDFSIRLNILVRFDMHEGRPRNNNLGQILGPVKNSVTLRIIMINECRNGRLLSCFLQAWAISVTVITMVLQVLRPRLRLEVVGCVVGFRGIGNKFLAYQSISVDVRWYSFCYHRPMCRTVIWNWTNRHELGVYKQNLDYGVVGLCA